jgi:ssDNA-binding replication factor A large subunit
MRRVDITATIQEIPDPRDVTTHAGERTHLATAIAFDKSERVKLTLWNEQIDQVKNNDIAKIENGCVTNFRGAALHENSIHC